MPFVSQNPYTGEKYFERQFFSDTELHSKLKSASLLFEKWKGTALSKRIELVSRIASHLRRNETSLAKNITREMGKPISESKAEIQKCALLVDYYVENAPPVLHSEIDIIDGIEQGVRRDPIGAVLGVMPWNFPFWQVFRFAIPSLLAGNVILLKHVPNMPDTAEKIDELIVEATGHRLLTHLFIKVDQIGDVLDQSLVRGACLTGSVKAGRSYAAEASKRLIPTVLELGSNDPFIILKDADLESACDTFIEARFGNTGQTCIAAKRLIVENPIYEKVESMVFDRIQNLSIADPMLETTKLSCMAREDLAQTLEKQWQQSVKAGGEALITPRRDGSRFSPGFLRNPPKSSPAWADELFGPVAVIQPARDFDHTLSLANDTSYGLGASQKAHQAISHLNYGTVVVNQKTASDPRWPFGGFKDSGYGRELGKEGLLEFVNLKTFKIEM